MKKFFAFFAFVSVIAFSSCSSSGDDGDEPQTIFIQYTANGTSIQFSESEITTSTNFAQVLDITGEKLNGGQTEERIRFFMNVDPSVGTYQIDGLGPNKPYEVSYVSDMTGNMTTGMNGTLTISSIENNIIQGTFTITGGHGSPSTTVSITNGSFRARLN